LSFSETYALDLSTHWSKLSGAPRGGGRQKLRHMLIGDSVTYDGRVYLVVGFTPASVEPAEVGLSTPGTTGTTWVELHLVRELEAPQRAALRVIPRHQPPTEG